MLNGPAHVGLPESNSELILMSVHFSFGKKARIQTKPTDAHP